MPHALPDVLLEPVAPHHAAAVQRLAADPGITSRTTLPEPYPEGGAAYWIEQLRPRQAAGQEYAFAVRDAEDGTLVGVTGLDHVDDEEAELGYWVGRPYWGRGYGTAGVRQTVRHAFEALGLERLYARPLQDNAPSRRILERLGFEAGPLETHEHPKWGDEKVVRYTLTRDAWQGRTA